jgi:hypothetical protein
MGSLCLATVASGRASGIVEGALGRRAYQRVDADDPVDVFLEVRRRFGVARQPW